VTLSGIALGCVWVVSHYIRFRFVGFRCVALRWVALRCVALHCVALVLDVVVYEPVYEWVNLCISLKLSCSSW
jgi:hypothetical protein